MEKLIKLSSVHETNKKERLKDNLKAQFDLPKLFKNIDSIHRTHGARVVYISSDLLHIELRAFQPACRLHPITVILREPSPSHDAKSYASALKNDKRESELVGEVAGMALSCGAAVLSWVVVFGSGVVIPISGGTSAAITYLGITAAVASTAQCFNGVIRTGLEVSNPETKDWLDSHEWYTNIANAFDILSLLGVAASSATVLKTVHLAKAASTKSTVEILKGLSRAERKRLTQEIIKSRNPGISAKVMKTLIRAGNYPSRFSQAQISKALSLKVQEAVAASLSFSGSASGGMVRVMAIGLYEETLSQ